MIDTTAEFRTDSVRNSALTPRGVAAAHLSRFQDQWDQLDARDRQWFAEWLTALLVDSCQEVTA